MSTQKQKDKERVKGLYEDLKALGPNPGEDYEYGLIYLVNFFSAIAKFQDGGPLKVENGWFSNKKVEEAKANLNRYIAGAGRCECGMNRTKPQEQVTIFNVYLGTLSECFGLSTMRVCDWLKCEGMLFDANRYFKGWQRNTMPVRQAVYVIEAKPFIASISYAMKICETILA